MAGAVYDCATAVSAVEAVGGAGVVAVVVGAAVVVADGAAVRVYSSPGMCCPLGAELVAAACTGAPLLAGWAADSLTGAAVVAVWLAGDWLVAANRAFHAAAIMAFWDSDRDGSASYDKT